LPMPANQPGPCTDARLIVERVRCFLKWHGEQFDILDAPHEPLANPVGWKRGDECWIRPDTWRDTIFDGDEDAAVNAARTLRDLDLLRVQDSRNCQAVVCVRDRKPARAYVVKPEIREWRLMTPADGDYATDGNNLGSTSLAPSADGSPPDLAGKLETATSRALDEALQILRLELPPDHRAYQAVLRAKTTILNSVLTNQVRVDEAKLTQKRESVLPELLERMKQFKEQRAREEEKEARLARERGWCDDSLSDKLAAEIYRKRAYPWLSYREKPGHPRSSNGS
jgi:hypothetical protein